MSRAPGLRWQSTRPAGEAGRVNDAESEDVYVAALAFFMI